MALNLKEKAEFARLQDEVRIARALRWTEPVARDLPAPHIAGTVTQGWEHNDFEVYQAWSSCIRHGSGVCVEGGGILTANGRRDLYSTELLALRALRCELERKAAEALATIDARIEQLKGAA
jgi:hypothetical protein